MPNERLDMGSWTPRPGWTHSEVWLERRVDNDWVVAFRVATDGHHFSIVEQRVSPAGTPPTDGLSALQTRQTAKVGGLLDAAREVLGEGSQVGWRARLGSVAEKTGTSWQVQAALAAYGQWAARQSRHPNVDVADALRLTTKRVTYLLSRARATGLMTGGGDRGRMGGEPTLAASEVITRAVKEHLGIADRDRPLYIMFEHPGDAVVIGSDAQSGNIYERAGQSASDRWDISEVGWLSRLLVRDDD